MSERRTWTLVIHAGDNNTFIADERTVDQWRGHPNFDVVTVTETRPGERLVPLRGITVTEHEGPSGNWSRCIEKGCPRPSHRIVTILPDEPARTEGKR